jgi:hypothetical protein
MAMSMCDVLAVLEDAEAQIWSTFDAAVDLAISENSRLTLAKTTLEAFTGVWLSPFAFGGVYVPLSTDPDVEAERILAKVAEFVPVSLPVTTVKLGRDNQESLRRLIRRSRFEAVVAGPKLFKQYRRFARDVRRARIVTVVADSASHSPSATRPSVSSPT